jgi:hypothetical protein
MAYCIKKPKPRSVCNCDIFDGAVEIVVDENGEKINKSYYCSDCSKQDVLEMKELCKYCKITIRSSAKRKLFVIEDRQDLIAKVNKYFLGIEETNLFVMQKVLEEANEIRKIHGVHILPFNIVNVKIWHRPGIHIIESIRCVGELKYILGLEKDGYIVKPIGIDAPFETRYNRMLKRGDIKTPKSLEEFIERQNAEWDQPEPYMQNIKECLALLDPQAVFQNLDGELSATVGRIWNYLNA